MTVKAKYTELADILIVSPLLQSFSNSWRYHENLKVEVLIEEYIKFISLEEDMYKLFSISMELVNSNMNYENNLELFKCFTLDVYLAQLTEIIAAEQRNEYATTIVPIYFYKTQLQKISYRNLPTSYRKKGLELCSKKLMQKGYKDIILKVSDKNIQLLHKVISAFALCVEGAFMFEIN